MCSPPRSPKSQFWGIFLKTPFLGILAFLGILGIFAFLPIFRKTPKLVIFRKTAKLANLGIFSISRKTGIFVKLVIFGNLIKKVKNGDFL